MQTERALSLSFLGRGIFSVVQKAICRASVTGTMPILKGVLGNENSPFENQNYVTAQDPKDTIFTRNFFSGFMSTDAVVAVDAKYVPLNNAYCSAFPIYKLCLTQNLGSCIFLLQVLVRKRTFPFNMLAMASQDWRVTYWVFLFISETFWFPQCFMLLCLWFLHW